VKTWVDGRLTDADDATVSAFDHGLTVGDGVFETLKVVDGAPFALTRHLDRLRSSAAGLGLDAPADDVLRTAVAEVLAAHAPAEMGRLRITLTGGRGPLGSDRGTAHPTLVVAVSPATGWPPSTRLAVVPWPRNERSAVAGLKTTSYAENVVALARAKAAGADEALFLDTRGHLCEGTGSNLFVVVGGRLLTPALSTGCLAGVTRALVLDWVGAEEAELPLSVLDDADEVFVTSSTRDVSPVATVDDRRYPAPGPVTARAQHVFAERSAADVDP
jgi:branched-chain amino acid aminotransferase